LASQSLFAQQFQHHLKKSKIWDLSSISPMTVADDPRADETSNLFFCAACEVLSSFVYWLVRVVIYTSRTRT
jgi:hypothetical protein